MPTVTTPGHSANPVLRDVHSGVGQADQGQSPANSADGEMSHRQRPPPLKRKVTSPQGMQEPPPGRRLQRSVSNKGVGADAVVTTVPAVFDTAAIEIFAASGIQRRFRCMKTAVLRADASLDSPKIGKLKAGDLRESYCYC
jgi:hypothetical protein